MTFGFGLERLGLWTARFPWASLAGVAVLTAVLLGLITRLEFSSDLEEIFRSDSPEFAQLEELRRKFPGTGQEILIVVEGSDLFTADNLDRLQNLHLDLSLTDGVRSVLSMFSARRAPDKSGTAEPVFPAAFDDSTDLERLREEVQRHPLVAGQLVSIDARLALVVLTLANKNMEIEPLRAVVGDIRKTADAALEGTDLDVNLTGSALMRIEIIAALFRDQITFSVAGFVIGFALCLVLLRSWRYALIAAAPALVSAVWLLGSMQLRGQEVNVLTSAIPALVLVLVFADAIHLLFAIRRSREEGVPLGEAVRESVLRIGPACVQTSVTTTLALLTLAFVPHPFISGFGLTAAIGTAIAYAVTMAVSPPLAVLLLRGAPEAKGADTRMGRLEGSAADFCRHAVGKALHWPRSTIFAGFALAAAAGALYWLAQPSYEYREYLPSGNSARLAMDEIDARLAGTESLHVILQWPEGRQFEPRETLEVIGEVHRDIAGLPVVNSALSLDSVANWYAGNGLERTDVLKFLKETDTQLAGLILSDETGAALVSARLQGGKGPELLKLRKPLEERLDRISEGKNGPRITLTGLALVAAEASNDMIGQLNRSLIGAIAIIILLIAVVLRSARAGAAAILPNLLPICLCGALLYLTGRGLQFTSVVAFTVGFGIAVDSSIHVFNMYRLVRPAAQSTHAALLETISKVGPVLIVTTIVLASGLGSTLLSELPNLRLFGQLIIVLLLTALVANLVLLPCMILVTSRSDESGAEPPSPRPAP